MEHFIIADHWTGVSPADVLDWEAEMVKDAIAIISARGRYQLRHPPGSKQGISGRTGIPLE